MAYISYNKLRESEFDGIVSKRDRLQDSNISKLELEVHDSYKKDERLTTNFEPNDNERCYTQRLSRFKIIENRWTLIKIRKRFQRI